MRPVPRLDSSFDELDALRLAAAQRRRRLAELDVAEADVLQRAQLVGDRREVLEQRQRLVDGQVEHVGDRLAAVLDLERLAVVAAALALLARARRRSGRKCISMAITPSPWHASQRPPLTLNEKRPGRKPRALRFGQHREQLADEREQAGVGRRVRARRAADRRLIDLDHLVDAARCPRSRRARPARRRRDRARARATRRGCR